MSVFQNFVKNNTVLVLHVFCTSILCVLLRVFFIKYPNYLLFGNLFLALLLVYCFYRIFFKNIYADSFLKSICLLAIIVAINQLYTYDKLIKIFPFLANINANWLVVAFVIIIVVFLIIFKLLTYMEPSGSIQIKKISDGILNEKNFNSIPLYNPCDNFLKFIYFLVMLVVFCIVLLIPVVLLYLFNKHGLDKTALDFDKLISFLVGYGVAFLLILFALIVVIITLTYVAKYIYIQICSFKRANAEDIEKLYPIPVYAFSVIIVCLLLFFIWRVTEFSLDDLTEILATGNYLVFPIAVIVTMILFFLLVQIIHAIILMLSKMSAEDVKKFIDEKEKELKIGLRITKIIESIVDIILDTIISILEFIKCVPNFFSAMNKMVLLDDDEVIEEDESLEK